MAEFRLTRQAHASLMQIGLYTQQRWGRQQRVNYLKMIDGCFQQLADNPLQGKARPEVHDQLRSYSVGKHVVFYQIKAEGLVVIVNVLHERMDPCQHFPI
jgi:toxin ParE1/3/4